MSLTSRSGRYFLCVAQSAMLLMPLPVLSANTSVGETARMSRYEQTIFGESKASAGTDARLGTLEKNLFGKTQKGSVTSRLDAIGKLLDDKGSSKLLPPQAGQLDTPASASAAPSSSHSVHYDSVEDAPVAAGNNDRVNSILQQAMAKHDQRDMAGAERLFRQVLSLDSQNTDALYNLGAINEGKGNVDGALANYRAALKTSPSDTDLQQAVASLEQKMQQKNAQKVREQQLAREQATQQSKQAQLKKLADTAGAAYRNGDYDTAVRNLETVAREAPNDPDVQLALAQAYRGKGDFNQARSHISRAVAVDPNNGQYRNVLSQIDQQASSQSAPSRGGRAPSPSSDEQQFANNDPPMAPSRSSGRGQQVANNWDESDSNDQDVQPITPEGSRQFGYASANNPQGGGLGGMLGGLAGLAGMGGMARMGGMGMGGMGMGMGGSPYGGGYPMDGRSRVKQAAVSGLTGAAIGAVMGGITRSGVKNGAVSGFMSGALSSFLGF